MSKKKKEIIKKEKIVKSINNNVRSSVRKLNPILKAIVGKKVEVAIRDLEFSEKRITKDVRKTISSAVANAENNFQYDIDKLIVKEAYCGKKIMMKRFRPRAKGRAAPILKPYSSVTIILSETKKWRVMGQKVNPVGFRLGVNRGWDSVWYAKKKDFGNYLIEDFKIREYIKKNVINSGVSKVMIERTSNKCYVTIYTSRPGFVIGKKGSDIDKIKNNLSKFTSNEVTLNIKEVKKPETNAYLVAENIAQQLVKRISYRRAMKRAMQSCLRLGAKGIKVSISGRLGGNEIARTEWLRDGSIPSHTLRADIDYAEAEALTTYGIIGIKVWIYKGEVFAKEFSQETNKVISKKGINNFMLQPVRTKWRKAHKGRIHGTASRANFINYGAYALKAITPERVTGKQIEAARVALTRHMKRQGRVWTRIFPNIPVSKKPIEVRMGKGKGSPEYYACRVKPEESYLKLMVCQNK